MRSLKITVSVEVRIVSPFLFLVVYVRFSLTFNAHTFGHCVIFSGKKITASPKSECAHTHGYECVVPFWVVCNQKCVSSRFSVDKVIYDSFSSHVVSEGSN